MSTIFLQNFYFFNHLSIHLNNLNKLTYFSAELETDGGGDQRRSRRWGQFEERGGK
jgi:hypothetical protein